MCCPSHWIIISEGGWIFVCLKLPRWCSCVGHVQIQDASSTSGQWAQKGDSPRLEGPGLEPETSSTQAGLTSPVTLRLPWLKPARPPALHPQGPPRPTPQPHSVAQPCSSMGSCCACPLTCFLGKKMCLLVSLIPSLNHKVREATGHNKSSSKSLFQNKGWGPHGVWRNRKVDSPPEEETS